MNCTFVAGCLLAMVSALSFTASADATTFCVPSFHPACPNSGGNVAQANIETAMQTSGSDGIPDTVLVDAVEIANPNEIQTTGSDPLTIQGAGPGATTLTTTSNMGIFVLDLLTGNTSNVTVRDLKIAVPASAPTDGGDAAQISGDTLENVDIVSRNPGSNGSGGIPSFFGGGTFRGGEIGTEAGGALSAGVVGGAFSTGFMIVEDATIRDAITGLGTTNTGSAIIASRTSINNPIQVGVSSSGGTVAIQNSTITVSGVAPLAAASNSPETGTVSGDHLTVINTGAANLSGLEASAILSSSGDANATLSNSILRGFNFAYLRQVGGSATGSANVTIRYSNVPATGNSIGPGTLDIGAGNITADPLFTSPTDFRLLAGSPSIDAGDPAAGGLTADFLGAPRPTDGDGNGSAIRDQGAYELQPPPPPDTTAPQTTIDNGPGKKKKLNRGKASFSFSSDEAGSTFECRLDEKALKPCASPTAYKRLKKGKHKFFVQAIDGAGNVDVTPASKKFKVKRRRR